MRETLYPIVLVLLFLSCTTVVTKETQNDTNTPLHLVKPDYPTFYGIPDTAEVKKTVERIHTYLNSVTPFGFVNSKTGEVLTDLNKMDENTTLVKGDFRIVSYEWGVTYGAMMKATAITGDPAFRKYAEDRLNFIAESAPYFEKLDSSEGFDWGAKGPLKNLLHPKALDDCGAMCAAMFKAKNSGSKTDFSHLTDLHLDYILNKEHRLSDGNLARMRPQANSLWLDDMFMAIPALAQAGMATGEARYFDEATHQIHLFTEKMFNDEKQVFMHGWIEGMSEHPQYHWGRANGWAILTLVEVLDVLPESHQDFSFVLDLLKKHVKGLAKYQDGTGFWHQLLDRNDTYLETSATAIYTYSFAHAINKGWIDRMAYAPAAILGWNALNSKINAKGQVEGTCVGTGMGFDPAFYSYRPVSEYAAHGYGPAILASVEIYELLKNNKFEINDSSVQILAK